MKKAIFVFAFCLFVFSCKKVADSIPVVEVQAFEKDSTSITLRVDTASVEKPNLIQTELDWRDQFVGSYVGIGLYANYQSYDPKGVFWKTSCRVEIRKGSVSTGLYIMREKITAFDPSTWNQDYFMHNMQYSAKIDREGKLSIPSQIIAMQPENTEGPDYNIYGSDRGGKFVSHGLFNHDTLTLHPNFEGVSLVDSTVLIKK